MEVNYVADIEVPQCSPLSSTLFLIAFQELMDFLHRKKSDDTELSAYVDDLVKYYKSKSIEKARKTLQTMVNGLINTGKKIGLEFSKEKIKTIHICRRRNPRRNCQEKSIKRVEKLKILGLTIQRKYKFDEHVLLLKDKLMKDLNLLKSLSSWSLEFSRTF